MGLREDSLNTLRRKQKNANASAVKRSRQQNKRGKQDAILIGILLASRLAQAAEKPSV